MEKIGDFFACALKNALADGVTVHNYDDHGDFSKLWGLEDSQAVFKKGKPIVIVWDGSTRPADSSDGSQGMDKTTSTDSGRTNSLAAHLTPLDWALAYSISVLDNNSLPAVSIHIVDLTGQDHDKWAFRWRHQLLAQMPWVSLHAPLIPTRADGEPAPYRAGYRPIRGENGDTPLLCRGSDSWKLFSSTTLKSCNIAGRREALRQLVDAWAATVARTHDHHDLNNLAGPWILTAASSCDPLIHAFRQKLKWTGLWTGEAPLGADASDSSGGMRPSSDWNSSPSSTVTVESSTSNNDTNSEKAYCHVLVVDDMLALGWDKVILKLFSLKPNGEKDYSTSIQPICDKSSTLHAHGAATPNVLLNALGWDTLGPVHYSKYMERCYDSPIPSDSTVPWLLVLDLMLFPGRSEEELKWFQKLLIIAQKTVDTKTDGVQKLAWPGFEEGELKSVENWLNDPDSIDSSAYETAMSLLPRLCALRWPAVPILLFSATSRRGLIGKLVENYGNIFDAPAKPDLLRGDIRVNAAAYFDAWKGKIQDAQNLVYVQKRLINLLSPKVTEADTAEESGPTGSEAQNMSGSTQNVQIGITSDGSTTHNHLTIAFDESGNFVNDRYSAIGGVIIDAKAHGKDAEKKAKRKTFEFLEALRTSGVHFYDHPPVYTEVHDAAGRYETGKLNVELIDKDTEIREKLRDVLRAHSYKHSVKVGGVRCSVSEELYRGSKGIDDRAYLYWLARTLELVLCEYLPSLGYTLCQTSLSIWLPTRSVRFDAEAGKKARQLDLYPVSDIRVQTVGGYSVAYEIVLRALEGRQRLAPDILERCHLKLRKIPYFDNRRRYDSALNWICPTCKKMISPHSSRPRLEPAGVVGGTMTQVKFCSKKVDYNLYSAAGDLIESRTGESGGKHIACRSCGADYIPADYSVAQHLADACLESNLEDPFPSSEIECKPPSNITGPLSFDVDAGEMLEDLLLAGRSFDNEESFRGLETCFRRNWFRGPLVKRNGRLTAPVEERVLMKCKEYSRLVDGGEIARLASIRLAGRITIMLGLKDANCVARDVAQILEGVCVRFDVREEVSNTGNPVLRVYVYDLTEGAELANQLSRCLNLELNHEVMWNKVDRS